MDITEVRELSAIELSGGILAAATPIPAGFPSPAQDYFDGRVDLNEHLISDKVSTFIVRVVGDSMLGAGINDGDELIVNRALTPRHGDVVIAVLDGELTVKRLDLHNGLLLRSENPDYPNLRPGEHSDFSVWGVATYCLHRLASATAQ